MRSFKSSVHIVPLTSFIVALACSCTGSVSDDSLSNDAFDLKGGKGKGNGGGNGNGGGGTNTDPDGGTGTDPSTNGRFELLGTHPHAAAETTWIAREINALHVFNGKLYVGYGDYHNNTGPVTIAPYDFSLGRFVDEHVSDTEAIYLYRTIGGKLYAPATDRHYTADFAVGPDWKDYGAINTTHAFDMGTFTGSDLWISGSQGNDAVAWRSTDGGATFQEMLRVPSESGIDGDFARFYFMGFLGGKLYVHATDYQGGPHSASHYYDGSTWRRGAAMLTEGIRSHFGWKTLNFADQLVYQTYDRGGYLATFSGSKMDLHFPVTDIEVDGGYLYVVASGEVRRSSDLRNWSTIASVPSSTRSLAVSGGEIFVGTSDSKVYQYVQ